MRAQHLGGHGIDTVFGHLLDLGYAGSFFWRGRRRDLLDFDVARHQVRGRRPYANNFVFESEERAA